MFDWNNDDNGPHRGLWMVFKRGEVRVCRWDLSELGVFFGRLKIPVNGNLFC